MRGVIRTIEVDGEPAALIPFRRLTLLFGALVEAAVAAAGLPLVLSGDLGAALWGLALFTLPFGTLAAVTVAGLGRPRGLALTPTRLTLLGLGRIDIPWEALDWVAAPRAGLRPRTLMIRARNRSAIRRAGLARILSRGALVIVPTIRLALPYAEAEALIERWRDDPYARTVLPQGLS
jgi:hypothetical protein